MPVKSRMACRSHNSIAPATVEDGLGDEETTLLDGEVMTPDIVGHEARAPEGSDHDEDPNA